MEPQELHILFERAFNAGDLDALAALYEPEAALVTQSGEAARGHAAIREFAAGLLSAGGVLELKTRFVVAGAGDLAMLSCDWALRPAPGAPPMTTGRTAEIARRQGDGRWLYAIDNPFAG